MANLMMPAGNVSEGQLYQRLQQTEAAPQGICVLTGDGRVLDWVLTFENDRAVREFLDYSLDRFRVHDGEPGPLRTRRYMQYPAQRMDDIAAAGDPGPITATHPAGEPCPALSRSHA